MKGLNGYRDVLRGRNRLGLFLCLLLVITFLLVTGCSSPMKEGADGDGIAPEQSDTSSKPTDPGSEPADANSEYADVAAFIMKATEKPVELSLYENSSGYTQEMFDELYGDHLKKKFPNLSIKLYSPNKESGGLGLPDLIAQGVKLDLIKVSGGNFYSFIANNQLEDDVSDLVAKYNFDLNQFHPAVLDQMLILGDGQQLFGIPNAVAATALFYNKDIFEKFGESYPRDRMTWDEIYDLAKKLTRKEDGTEYLGFQENISFLTITNQLSQSFLDPVTNKATVQNDNWKNFINNFARFHSIEGNEMLPSYNDAMWKDGRVAMAVGSSGGSWNFTFNAPFDWDLVELPVLKEFPNSSSGLQVPFHAISIMSQHRDLAFLVSAYIASEEFQREFATLGYVPPIVIDDLESILGSAVPQLAGKNIKGAVPLDRAARPFLSNGYQSLVANEVNNAYRAVARGQKDVNTALRDAEEAANSKINEAIMSK